MTKMMLWLGRPVLVSALLFPALSPARSSATQTVNRANLVGTWVNTRWEHNGRPDSQYVRENIYTFRADSTWDLHWRWNGVEDTARLPNPDKGHWELQGDTLRMPYPRGGLVKLVGRGEQILLAGLSDKGFTCADTLRRVDGSKPLPLPDTTPRPITISAAALVGTWVRGDTSTVTFTTAGRAGPVTKTDTVIKTDTLAFRADSTAQQVLFSPGSLPARTTGKWGLYPGDILWLQEDTRSKGAGQYFPYIGGGVKVMLEGQQLVFDGCQYGDRRSLMYRRVSP